MRKIFKNVFAARNKMKKARDGTVQNVLYLKNKMEISDCGIQNVKYVLQNVLLLEIR